MAFQRCTYLVWIGDTHLQLSIPTERMVWARLRDGKVEGKQTEDEKVSKQKMGERTRLSYAVEEGELFPRLWGLKIFSSIWTSPCQDPLPTTAMLTRQYCLPLHHSPLQGLWTLLSRLLGHWNIMLPGCHKLLNDSSSQHWPMNQQGA